jgi:metal-sulfur cluster biosynthetic enzyme
MAGDIVTTLKQIEALPVSDQIDPPWTKERMSEAARLQLGIFD